MVDLEDFSLTMCYCINMRSYNKKKYTAILHYLISQCGSRPSFGKTVLWKLLYFSDFNFYELNQNKLIGETYRHINYGPAPEHFNLILKELIKEKKIEKIDGKFGPYTQQRFIARNEPDLTVLSADEIKTVDHVIERYGSMTATQIEDASHRDIPVEATLKRSIIDYNLVFYRESPFSVRSYED